jgi:hypothetical protein
MSEEIVAEGQGQQAPVMPAWMEGLEDDLRNDPVLADYRNESDIQGALPKIIKTMIHGQRLIGQKGILVPKKDAPPEEWDKYYTELGRPKDPSGYEIGKPADWPEHIPYQQEVEEAFRQEMFKIGMPAEAVSKIFKWYNGFSLDQHKVYEDQAREAAETGIKALKKEWGPDFEDNYRAAGGVLVKHGGEDLAGRNDLKNDPQLLGFLFKVAQALGEDKLVQGGPGGSQSIDDQIDETEGKMKEMVGKGTGGEGNPEYKALMIRRNRLYDQKHPPKKKE